MLNLNHITVTERQEKEPDKLFLVGSISFCVEKFVPKSQRGKPAAMRKAIAAVKRELLGQVYGGVGKAAIDAADTVPDSDLLG